MAINQATFLRIDTIDSKACLQDKLGELVVSSLIEGHNKGWYELVGFVVLPAEVQLLIVSHGKATNDLLKFLEAQLQTTPDAASKIFDMDYYREKIDSPEEIRDRLRWMYASPIRSRLSQSIDSYPYSSANARFQGIITAKVM